MSTYPIVTAPDPRLKMVCEPCEVGDPSLIEIAHTMAETMYANQGCGLAAPQVGLNKRLIVVDCTDPETDPDPIYLVNPEIVELQGEALKEEEGCLSCPGVAVPITRQPFARVRYFDLEGNECEIAGDGLLGRCLQHEIDHLNGITLFESCSVSDRLQALHEYHEALAHGAKPGQTNY